jgi:uncharacterized membrane protein YjgN (DUF898 family)
MQQVQFEGNGAEYFKIWIVNIMLTIITLGLYYPWAKVRNKRYFYANTTLEGRNFEYHATGKQLFLGYLVAMTLFITYVMIEKISPVGSFVVLGLLFIAIPWLVWRSMKFNMRMTSFSNVRFSFRGNLKNAYINFFVYPFIFFLSFLLMIILVERAEDMDRFAAIASFVGLVGMGAALYMFALLKQRNLSYLMGNICYGQGGFKTDYKVSEFVIMAVKTGIIGTIIMVVIMVIVGGGFVAVVGIDELRTLGELKAGVNIESEEAAEERVMGILVPLFVMIYGGMILGTMIISAHWIAQQREYVYKQTQLDETITFLSTLKASSLAWVMLSNLFLVMITAGFAYPWTKVRLAKLMVENSYVDVPDGFDEYMTQKQEKESSLGEQIGDAFDVQIDVGF